MERRLILFDFGGTLNTDGAHWGAIFRRDLLDLGGRFSVEEVEAAYIASERRLVADGPASFDFAETLRRQVIGQYEHLGLPESDAVEQAGRYYEQVTRRMRDVRAFFARIASKSDLGIVSNFYGNLDVVLREFDIDSRLVTSVDSARVGVRKPDPEIWQIGISRAGYEAERTVVVGDSYRNDIAPATSLGCRTIWYRGLEWRKPDETWSADVEVRSLSELESAIDAI